MLYVVGWSVVILKVAVGLGFVIFVHELGHFLVAKMCGVKCEKFYLGFDFGGLKLCRFRWGETEYGIGVFPLGGYVKMLGQEDNPARLREELERAKQGDGGTVEGGEREVENAVGSASETPASRPPSTAPPLDPRSFLAKSVPQRMAIISAGVIMNMIFAFLMAVVAFSIGVKQIPCVIGGVLPGDPAWQADIRVGDRILEIAGKKMTQFRDLLKAITLGDVDAENPEVPILVKRPGVSEPFTIVVRPDCSRGVFLIGVANGYLAELAENRTTWLVHKQPPVLNGSPAAHAEPAFHNGDKIVRIDDVPIDDYAEINRELAQKADRKITVTVARTSRDAEGKPIAGAEHLTIPVARNPMRTLGAVMQMGPITAVQADSPAAAAKLEPGDLLLKVDGRPIDDPMTLPSQLARRAEETVELTVQRKASEAVEVLRVKLRRPIGYLTSDSILLRVFDRPVEISSLGVAYRVPNRIERVVEHSPAAKAGLLAGDVVIGAALLPPDKDTLLAADAEQSESQIPFDDEKDRNWPMLMAILQDTLPGTTVRLTILRQEREQTVTLQPVEADDWFNPDRGFLFDPLMYAYQADGLANALVLGGRETLENTTFVYRSLRALGTARVSPRGLVGPVGIVKWAVNSADQSNAKFLLFLTMLSANLAVINFLPIPLLDGGLMVFLLYEGIRRKPANEHVQVVLTYLGLLLIIALMVWVLGLDFGLIPRR